LSNYNNTEFYTIWPCKSHAITSPYGPRELGDGFHDGIDIAPEKFRVDGDTIFATHDSTAALVDVSTTYGNRIVLDDKNLDYSTVYGHLSKVIIKEGQSIKCGDIIGYMGNTGASTGTHLHYEIRTKRYKGNESNYWNSHDGEFYSSEDPMQFIVDIDLSVIPMWGRMAWAWMYKEGLNDGIGFSNSTLEGQIAVFMKRYYDKYTKIKY